MRVAAIREPGVARALVEISGTALRRLEFDVNVAAWKELPGAPPAADDRLLEPPFPPRAVIAPGPRLEGPPDWQERHREFHVKPASVIAPARSALPRAPASVRYRVQAGLVFGPMPRCTPAGRILDRLIGCHLVTELIDVDAFRIDWEGPRWHIRFGEGMSFDGACPVSPVLATPDEFPPEGIGVQHAGGTTLLAWDALADFAALVNRYLELGPELLILAGWPLGPVLAAANGRPQLTFDTPISSLGTDGAWADNSVLGRVECRLEAVA